MLVMTALRKILRWF